MLFLLLLLPSFLAAAAAVGVRPYRYAVGRLNAALAFVTLGAAVEIGRRIAAGAAPPTFGPGELFRIDGLSALLLLCIGIVAVVATVSGPGFARSSHYDAAQMRSYQIFIHLTIEAMLVAVSANNVGLMWIAIEATTIFSAMIIPLTLSKASVEASWKYILICSVGIALAFAGTVLGYFDFVSLSGERSSALNWTVLRQTAPLLHAQVLQLAFVFLLIGYGTKAGIAPMHTWLPDAHSEAPAALSATMSGVLLAVALYAILRWKVVVDAAVRSPFTDRLLIALGVASLIVAAFTIVLQRNYKRMLAYSSIEHTGLMCIGLGLGPLGAFAAFLHLVNHTAAKSLLFVLSGRVLERYRTTELARVSGLLETMPWTGALFTVGMLAILGLPPFGLFLSEFALLRAGFAGGRVALMLLVLALVGVAFGAIVHHMNRMLHGAPPEGLQSGERLGWDMAPVVLNLALLVVLGVTLPAPLAALIQETVRIVSRS